jgi:hypothetical protein
VAALQGEEVSPAFFAALARVRAIHDHCRQLLRNHHQVPVAAAPTRS